MKKIELKGKRGKGKFILVDDDITIEKFYLDSTGYARFWDKKFDKTIRFHSFIMKTPKGFYTDHINMNRLDNRRSNLRIVTPSQNQGNQNSYKNSTSKYKGVYWSIQNKHWISQIRCNNMTTYIGQFKSELHAAMAYDINAKILFDEFARLNFKSVA